jgi:hypothetical protein
MTFFKTLLIRHRRFLPGTFKMIFIGLGFFSLQVSFPITSSKEGFHGDLTFCLLVLEDLIPMENLTKCVYKCQCKNTSECQEIILFMAKHDNISEWSLCELSAHNVN